MYTKNRDRFYDIDLRPYMADDGTDAYQILDPDGNEIAVVYGEQMADELLRHLNRE